MASSDYVQQPRRSQSQQGCSILLFLALLIITDLDSTAAWTFATTRRHWVATAAAVVVPASSSSSSWAASPLPPATNKSFRTKYYGQQEYTNSITASKDTNISPAEAYDVIRDQIPRATTNNARALDLGAGAGLSTQLLYERGYTTIDAVDWSQTAWNAAVEEQPDSVRFYTMSDQEFLDNLLSSNHDNNDNNDNDNKYDAIVYNFAVNPDKAQKVAQRYLTETGRLLAPCNDRRDYWYKQSYLVMNRAGQVLWKSTPDIGAWMIQFQPDVESPTCTGIWCGSFNGFDQEKLERQLQRRRSSQQASR